MSKTITVWHATRPPSDYQHYGDYRYDRARHEFIASTTGEAAEAHLAAMLSEVRLGRDRYPPYRQDVRTAGRSLPAVRSTGGRHVGVALDWLIPALLVLIGMAAWLVLIGMAA